jgi:hypothetical protein
VLKLSIAYRLYTVVPRLLDLIDELTNWYIRFNRRRLKGENGPEDAVAALNSLFEALLTLCRTLVSAPLSVSAAPIPFRPLNCVSLAVGFYSLHHRKPISRSSAIPPLIGS